MTVALSFHRGAVHTIASVNGLRNPTSGKCDHSRGTARLDVQGELYP
jgi:hypothetical protein